METAPQKFIHYPMLISEFGPVPPAPDEDKRIWERFDALPEFNRAVLIAHELPDRIEELQRSLGLSDEQTAIVSLLVRKYYFGEAKLEDVRASLLGLVPDTPEIWELFQQNVLSVKPSIEESKTAVVPAPAEPKAAATLPLPLLQALSKFPDLGSQQLTAQKIRIRAEREPVRPTLFNWLKYYRDELGIGYHDSVQRGQFLYRSENGRGLSPEERERINLVLKSVEDELPLTIDPGRKAILFPAFEKSAPRVQPPSVSAPAPIRAMEERYQKPAPAKPAPAPKLSFSPAPKMSASQKPEASLRPKERVLAPSAPAAAPGRPGRESIVREAAFEPAPLRTSFFRKAASTAPLGNLTFTTRHVMPAEEIGKSIPAPAARPAAQPAPVGVPPKRSPFSIRPVSRG